MEDTHGMYPPLNSSDLLSGGRWSRLRSQAVVAAALVPGFICGHVILIPFGSANWVLCFGMCLGGFACAVANGVVASRAR